ncbi:MAG: hypothetical protein KDE33_17700 [Bacteroidetes bacterium]|nr:hypothetical protein [Bacteroidota bacterium]
MYIKDKDLLKELADYKLQYGYCCSRCGHNEFSNGKEDFSRRCRNTKCRYEEGIFKHTVFENCKFSLDKALSLISEIKETSVANNNDEIMFHDKEGFVSLEKFTELHNNSKQKPPAYSTNEKIYTAINLKKKSIRQLSQQYNIEANTITKFVSMLSTRIHGEIVGKRKNPHLRVIDYFLEEQSQDLEFFHHKFMFPLPGKWEYGCRIINEDIITTVEYYDREKSAIKFMYVRYNLNQYHKYIKRKLNSVEGNTFRYGEEAWKHFFCKNYDCKGNIEYSGDYIHYQQ